VVSNLLQLHNLIVQLLMSRITLTHHYNNSTSTTTLWLTDSHTQFCSVKSPLFTADISYTLLHTRHSYNFNMFGPHGQYWAGRTLPPNNTPPKYGRC